MKSLKREYFGTSVIEEQSYTPKDFHCPMMGGPPTRLNYWYSQCLLRQDDPAIEMCTPSKTCASVAPQVNKPTLPAKVNLIKILHNQGLTYTEIADRVECSYSTVYKYVKKGLTHA